MARIRTIKPEFFKHEELFALEEETGLPIRLSFAGLWICCDREGRFKWRPRQLKTDILPYDDIDFSRVLDALLTRGFLVRYSVKGALYGCVPSFRTHQIINNREAGSTLPGPEDDDGSEPSNDGALTRVVSASSTRDARVEHAAIGEGKGKEGKGKEGKEVSRRSRVAHPEEQPGEKKQGDQKGETELQAACRSTWKAYASAFFDRYGTEPIRNAKVNSSIKGFVQRVGFAEAPHIAAFYLSHTDAFYLKKCHDPGLLQSDAEKLRTEWATNRKVTSITARQQERVGTMSDTVAEILAERGQA